MTEVNLTIDGKKVTVPEGTNLIEAARMHGAEIPHYCYHPALSAPANCRMCLVDVEKSRKPVTACNTQACEGMVVTTNSEKIKDLRRSVMEFLLVNHPLDCPTCDQAGECKLQDYYMQYDEIPSRFKEHKVEKDKMVDLGANVMLDQERCIACSRCVRFCDEISKTEELALINRGDHTEITTYPDKKLSNAYAGNVVDICPVGALTNKKFRFKKRVWFLNSTPSVCPGCSRGCNIRVDHEEGKIYRLVPRLNQEVNSYWMCDEGRFGFSNINENRVLRPRIRVGDSYEERSYEDALSELVGLMTGALVRSCDSAIVQKDSNALAHQRTSALTQIAIVAHASQTNEVLKAWCDFAKNVLKTNLLFYSKNDPANPSFDDYLITKDKNPNMSEIERLGLQPISALVQLCDSAIVQKDTNAPAHQRTSAPNIQGLLILDRLSEKDEQLVRESKIPVLAVWAFNETPVNQLARVVLPIPSYAEQDGHFTNIDKKIQKITKAFTPRGESKPVGETLAILKNRIV